MTGEPATERGTWLAVRTMVGQAIGVVSGSVSGLLWIWAMMNPKFDNAASLLVGLVMAVIALVVVIAATKAHATVVVVLFFISFFPIGVYLIGMPHWYRYLGYLDLGYLFSGLLMWSSSKPPPD